MTTDKFEEYLDGNYASVRMSKDITRRNGLEVFVLIGGISFDAYLYLVLLAPFPYGCHSVTLV